ncbi:PIG-L family deacetylase [Candidatus Woesearchaeota archaeon]|nr:PIG-L family deacetylase [Candidatus Woesearchaeota archaeon]
MTKPQKKPKETQKKKTILIICAHSDDQILGAGGTIKKYNEKGYEAHTIIFSYGELSHFHLKKDYVKEMRIKESEEAENIIGGKGITFYDHTDGQIKNETKTKQTHKLIKQKINELKPEKIFTHSQDDIHPDHRAVYQTVLDAYNELPKKTQKNIEIYSFEISQLWNLKKRKTPVLVIDITTQFKAKIKALHAFKSQINIFSHTYEVNLLYLGVYVRAFIAGLIYKKKLAEIFYKIK